MRLDPIPTLQRRIATDLADQFAADRPIRFSRAPGRLDVMGGIADYTGSLVCEATLDRAAAVALQDRTDRLVQIFSLNLLEQQQASHFSISLDVLATISLPDLHEIFTKPAQRWAGYLAGCLFLLRENGLIDLANPKQMGMNLALYSTVPLGAGVSSSAAIEVATMMNLVEHFGLREKMDPLRMSAMCQSVENRVVGAPCGIMDQVSSCLGEADSLLRMICQPHEIQPPLHLPPGTRVIGINSNVRHSVGGGMYGITRCAAFMGHKIILEKMREMGLAAGATMQSDPMNGYLANLDPDDYKRFFRPFVPEFIDGQKFLDAYGPTIDRATCVDPSQQYHVQHATDHHVLEARRVKRFVDCLTAAAGLTGVQRKKQLDMAGHLMYASHLSYTNDAMLGADECDLLVQLVREREPAGLYGAKITGGGSGGTVAVLAEHGEGGEGVGSAISQIMQIYEQRTGRKPEALLHTSPGAWHVGTTLICPA